MVNLLEHIVESCDSRYVSYQCVHCTYGTNCPHNCEKCLEYVHFPQRAPSPRHYDCLRMMDYYVCKYANKYTSELIYAMNQYTRLKYRAHLNVLSIGCGPCTDLCALSYLHDIGEYHFNSIEYRGVELAPQIWQNIHSDIRGMIPDTWIFDIVSADICQYIDNLLYDEWSPNLIVFQYVLSDMQKHTNSHMLDVVLSKIACYFDSNCLPGSFIICNDINLTKRFDGGLDHFDTLCSRISSPIECQKIHFPNNTRKAYSYGDEWPQNNLLIPIIDSLFVDYHPFLSCGSAQMTIMKKEEGSS